MDRLWMQVCAFEFVGQVGHGIFPAFTLTHRVKARGTVPNESHTSLLFLECTTPTTHLPDSPHMIC